MDFAIDGEFIVVGGENRLHEEVGAGEGVEAKSLVRRAVEQGIGSGTGDGGHVALLAGLLVLVVAVEPFNVRHLLRETACRFSCGVERGGVERVAGSAEAGLAKMIRLREGKAGGCGVHGDGAGVGGIRPEDGTVVLIDGRDG